MNGDGWGYWVFIFLLVLIHLVLRVTLGLGELAPDLLTVAVLLGARAARPSLAAMLGLVLGILRDALAVGGMGSAAVVLTVLGYLGARTQDLFEGESVVFAALYLFLGKWLHDSVYWLLRRGPVREGDLVEVLLIAQPIAALYAAAAGVALLVLFRGGSSR